MVPIKLGLILPPAAFAMKLISELLVPAEEIVRVPVEILDPIVPVVVSKVTLTALPLVLAAITKLPFWSILLFDVNVTSEPLAALIAPD